MAITLYSTHCPKCKILEKKLTDKHIEYSEVNDTNTMIEKGFMTVPMLVVDDKTMDFAQANQWINER